MSDLFEKGGALFDQERIHRYRLWRIWDETKGNVMFIGLNPSKANEDTNDPTTKRCIGFAKSWGFGGMYLMNCFPHISTNPKNLRISLSQTKINLKHLFDVSKVCDVVVFAWGNFDVVIDYAMDQALVDMFPNAMCLGFNKNGSPKHPLYISSKKELEKFCNKVLQN